MDGRQPGKAPDQRADTLHGIVEPPHEQNVAAIRVEPRQTRGHRPPELSKRARVDRGEVDADPRRSNTEALDQHFLLVLTGDDESVGAWNRPPLCRASEVAVRPTSRVVRDQPSPERARNREQHVEAAARVVLDEKEIRAIASDRREERSRGQRDVRRDRRVGRIRAAPAPGRRRQIEQAPEAAVEPRRWQDLYAAAHELMLRLGQLRRPRSSIPDDVSDFALQKGHERVIPCPRPACRKIPLVDTVVRVEVLEHVTVVKERDERPLPLITYPCLATANSALDASTYR